MWMHKKKSFIAAFEVYATYLLTGAACTAIGASLNLLMKHYGVSLAQAAALASCIAVGRVATVFLSGVLTEKLGSRVTLAMGVFFLFIYLLLLPVFSNYFIGMALTIVAGIGMGMTDSSCPSILNSVFINQYRSALGAGQIFFGAGCFLPPAIISLLIVTNAGWQYMYYIFALIALAILLLIPFIEGKSMTKPGDEAAGIGKSIRSLMVGKHTTNALILLGISTFVYCAMSSIIHTYLVSYVLGYGGISEAAAVNTLTLYSVGSMAGSVFFTALLRKCHGTLLLYMNPAFALAALILSLLIPGMVNFIVIFFIAGIFLGVIFSVLVGVASELLPGHTAIAASLIAFVGGCADVLSPIGAGVIETSYGIKAAFSMCVILAIVMTAAGIALRLVHLKTCKRLLE